MPGIPWDLFEHDCTTSERFWDLWTHRESAGFVEHRRVSYGNTLKSLEVIWDINAICNANLGRGLFEYYAKTLEKGWVR